MYTTVYTTSIYYTIIQYMYYVICMYVQYIENLYIVWTRAHRNIVSRLSRDWIDALYLARISS